MTWALVCLLFSGAAAGAVCAFMVSAAKIPSMLVRVLYATSVISAGAVVLKTFASIAVAPASDVNACQLAPIVGMTQHQPLYPDPLTGAISAWTDGPLAAVLFAPAAIGRQPTSQIILGVCLNLVFILVPTFIFLRQIAGSARNVMLWPCLTLILWWMTGQPSLNGISFAIGADGMAMALIVGAIAFLKDGRSTVRVACSAVCVALACWTKVGVFPVAGVLAIYLAIAQSPKSAGVFGGVFAGAVCLLGLCLISVFGAGNIWFHMITLFLAQPWMDGAGQQVIGIAKIGALGGTVLSLIHETRIPLIALAALGTLSQLLVTQPRRFDFKAWLAASPWIVLPASAMALIPAALIGFLKMGRNPESFGIFGLLIAILAGALAIRMYRGAELAADSQSRQLVVASVCILLIWESIGTLFTAGGIPSLIDAIQHASANKQENVFAFSQQHPHQTYFPWNTLSTLLADGKLYPSAEALRLRTGAATIAPSTSQLGAQFPDNLRWIAMDPSHSNEIISRIFPRANVKVDLPGLEGFSVYTGPGVGAP